MKIKVVEYIWGLLSTFYGAEIQLWMSENGISINMLIELIIKLIKIQNCFYCANIWKVCPVCWTLANQHWHFINQFYVSCWNFDILFNENKDVGFK